jgi:hypothetical protein
MEEFLIMLLQFCFETLGDVLCNATFDWPFDWPFKKRAWNEADDWHSGAIWPACAIWFGFACAAGGFSLLVFPRTLIALPVLRIANLIVAPLLSAKLALVLARRRARRHVSVVPRYHFWKSFWFTLGLAAIRFAYAQRG